MVVTEHLSLRSEGKCDIIDITPQVQAKVSGSAVNSGTVTVFVAGSTAGITTIEFESGLLADFPAMWERIIPSNTYYKHDSRWGDGNGYSHIRASLLGPSLVVPFNDKQLILGMWQQIIFVDFDNRPRSRQVVLQIMGE
jgi:secondary thiamine-phosphate synthase enzyme